MNDLDKYVEDLFKDDFVDEETLAQLISITGV